MTAYDISQATDVSQIRTFLSRDVSYAAYALADLELPYFTYTEWHVATRSGIIEGLAMVYDRLEPPILFLMGSYDALGALLRVGVGPDRVFITAPAPIMSLLREFYSLLEPGAMFRMRITHSVFSSYAKLDTQDATFAHIETQDAPEVTELITAAAAADGRDLRDIAFEPCMINDGFYRGIRLQHTLVAVAGTHVVAPTSGVAAIGNVVVHPDYRCRGFGTLVSQRVTEAVLNRTFELVVLNVRQDNLAANKIYRRMGYWPTTDYIEGFAERYSARVFGGV